MNPMKLFGNIAPSIEALTAVLNNILSTQEETRDAVREQTDILKEIRDGYKPKD